MGWGRKIQEHDKIRAWVDAGRPFAPYDQRPRLTEADAVMREAWVELDSCRPRTGMGVSPIPWTAIEQYAEARGFDDRERFHALIRRMDRAFLDAMQERQDEHEKREKRGTKKKQKQDADT